MPDGEGNIQVARVRKFRLMLGCILALVGIGWLAYWGIGFGSYLIDNSNTNYLLGVTFANNLTGAVAGALIVIGVNCIRKRQI